MKKVIFTILFIACFMNSYEQVITPFTARYQTIQRGGIRYISNTAVSCNGAGACATSRIEAPPAGTGYNNSYTAAYVDVDTDGTTFQSSSDSLALESCSEISWAGLYWGGEMTSASGNYATRNQCKIKVNTGSYTNLTADASQDNFNGFDTYHCYKDITSIVQAAGTNARFTVANVGVRVGGTNRFGGWTIVVVYKNDLQPMRTISVFNGLSNVSGANPTTDITVSGFKTPSSGAVTFEVGAVSYDGDRSLTGDQIQFNGTGSFVNISDAANNSNDVFNSSLTYGGVAKTTPFLNPAYTNTLGYDADIFVPNNASLNYIGNNVTSATLRLTTGSGGETFLTQVVTIAIDVAETDLRTTVRVEDLNGGTVQPGDILKYTVTGKNKGSDPAVNTYITDTLEKNITFVPGSITITYGPNLGVKTDASGDDQAEYVSANNLVKVRIGTGANSSTGGQVLSSIDGTDSTQFTYMAVATSDCILLLCDNIINNQSYIFGTGNTSGTTLSKVSTPGTNNASGCANAGATISTIINTCTSPTATSNSPACTGAGINLYTTYSAAATYSWSGPSSFSSTSVNPVISSATAAMAGTYTATISVPSTTCSYTASTTVAVGSATQTGGLAGTAGGGSISKTQDVAIGAGYYSDASCNLIGRLQATGASPVTGNVTAKVWIESSVPLFNNSSFVARHYEITPATNAGTATGTITLYFLQSEFNAFNAAPGSVLKLPTGSADATGIANLRIGKYSGTSSNGSGLPGTYTSTGATVIDPVDADIVWNATESRWQVTFSVSGFSGFIVQTKNYVLPVTWISFTAQKQDESVTLKWQTAQEANTSHFVIEHGTDGRSFAQVGSTPAAGSSNSLRNYSFVHSAPQTGDNFYRLQQVDADSRINYSSIATITIGVDNNFTITENPVRNGKLAVQFKKAGTASICNMIGQVIITKYVPAGKQTIDVQNLTPGVYLIRTEQKTMKFIVE